MTACVTAWAYEQVCKARDKWQRRAEGAAGRGDALYVGLAALDRRDGSDDAKLIQSLREHYEWQCMGDEPSPAPISDDWPEA